MLGSVQDMEAQRSELNQRACQSEWSPGNANDESEFSSQDDKRRIDCEHFVNFVLSAIRYPVVPNLERLLAAQVAQKDSGWNIPRPPGRLAAWLQIQRPEQD